MCERDEMYSISALRVSAVVQPPTDDDAGAPAQAPFAEHMQYLDIVRGISQIHQGTLRSERNHIRLRSVKLQLNPSMVSLVSITKPDWPSLLKGKPVNPVSFDLCILPPANSQIVFGRRRRHRNGSCVCGGIDM